MRPILSTHGAEWSESVSILQHIEDDHPSEHRELRTFDRQSSTFCDCERKTVEVINNICDEDA